MVAMIGTLCVAGVASAEPPALIDADFAGRWVSAKQKLTLDLAPCGDVWCGVVVNEGACGDTALRMNSKPDNVLQQLGKSREMSGQLRLARNAQPYGVLVRLIRDDNDGALRLAMTGHTGGIFAPMRRSYDFHGLFAREGDAACAPAAKTS